MILYALYIHDSMFACACMHAGLCVTVCVWLRGYLHKCVYVCVCVLVWVFACMSTKVSVCLCLCVSESMTCVCLHV